MGTRTEPHRRHAKRRLWGEVKIRIAFPSPHVPTQSVAQIEPISRMGELRVENWFRFGWALGLDSCSWMCQRMLASNRHRWLWHISSYNLYTEAGDENVNVNVRMWYTCCELRKICCDRGIDLHYTDRQKCIMHAISRWTSLIFLFPFFNPWIKRTVGFGLQKRTCLILNN